MKDLAKKLVLGLSMAAVVFTVSSTSALAADKEFYTFSGSDIGGVLFAEFTI